MRGLDTKPTKNLRIDVIICIFLVASIAAVYYRVLHAGFIIIDDPSYVVLNTEVHTAPTLTGIAYAFRAVVQATWQPLIFLSFMCDWMLYGLNPMGYHLTNLLLHTATTLLLFFVLRRMTVSQWRSGVVAALFAIHPLHVESVAWVSERKDTLSALFWVLTMLAYVHYADRPNGRRYVLVASVFALGLLAKPMLVTLPIVLLLIDYWPLGRMQKPNTVWKLVREKLPLLGLAIICGVVAIVTQRSTGALAALSTVPVSARLENTVVGYASYIGKMFWPRDLAVLYPSQPNGQLSPALAVAGSVILLAAISILVMKCRQKYLKFGWLWFIITLIPVIGIVQVGVQSMADRYTYIPLIGLFVMIAWGMPDALKLLPLPGKPSAYLSAITVVVMAILMVCTWRQVGYWDNEIALYEHTLSITSNNWFIESSLAQALGAQGRFDEATPHFQAEIETAPEGSKLYGFLGLSYAKEGKYDKAIEAYITAIQTAPPDERAKMHPALQEAIQSGVTQNTVLKVSHDMGFRIDPVQAHMTKVKALVRNDDFAKAIEECNKALRIDPSNAGTHYTHGVLMLIVHDTLDAYTDFGKAVECNPAYWPAYLKMAGLDFDRGDYAKSWKHTHLCQKYGGHISDTNIALLSAKMPDPDPNYALH